MKKIVLIIVITIISLITIVGVLYFVSTAKQENVDKIVEERIIDTKMCNIDSDCVAASCCHSTDVVNKKFAPDCDGVMCTMSCETVLDCGQGQPVCGDGVCTVKIQ